MTSSPGKQSLVGCWVLADVSCTCTCRDRGGQSGQNERRPCASSPPPGPCFREQGRCLYSKQKPCTGLRVATALALPCRRLELPALLCCSLLPLFILRGVLLCDCSRAGSSQVVESIAPALQELTFLRRDKHKQTI